MLIKPYLYSYIIGILQSYDKIWWATLIYKTGSWRGIIVKKTGWVLLYFRFAYFTFNYQPYKGFVIVLLLSSKTYENTVLLRTVYRWNISRGFFVEPEHTRGNRREMLAVCGCRPLVAHPRPTATPC